MFRMSAKLALGVSLSAAVWPGGSVQAQTLGGEGNLPIALVPSAILVAPGEELTINVASFIETTSEARAAFIERLFEDLLGRAPTPTELAERMSHNGAGSVVGSTMFIDDAQIARVRRAYERMLDRQATEDEIRRNLGLDDEQVIERIVDTGEYFAQGGGTNEGFLDRLFTDLLGRSPNQDELGLYLATLSFGAPRSAIATTLLQSPEFLGPLLDERYQSLLGRPPTTAESSAQFQFVLASLDLASSFIELSRRDITDSIFRSPEYYNRNRTVPVGYTAQIDWGDGQVSEGAFGSSKDGFTVQGSHTYIAAGRFFAKVTVFDELGNTRSVEVDANVLDFGAGIDGLCGSGSSMSVPMMMLGAGFLRLRHGGFRRRRRLV